MNARRLTTVLAAVSGAMAAVLGVLGLTVAPVALLVALPFGVAAYLLRGQAIEAAAYERAEFRRRATAAVDARVDRGVDGLGGRDRFAGGGRGTDRGGTADAGAGVGPDEWDWSDPVWGDRRRRRTWRAAADAATGGPTGAGGVGFGRDVRSGTGGGPHDARSPVDDTNLSTAAARELLEVGPDADHSAIRRAYRERAKELHPDQGGDEAAFRELTRAYDRLRE